MKKMLSLVLALVMVLSLCACGSSGNGETTGKEQATLSVGFGKVSITPDYSVQLRGHGDDETRWSEGVESNIYATCIAFTSGEETILVYTVDNLGIEREFADAFRKDITAATGIPGEKIFFGGTHCHNCPSPVLSEQYLTDMTKGITEAGKQAIADQAPASMLAAAHEVKGMNFARHYKNADGSIFGSNFGTNVKAVEHVGEKDSQLTLLKFDREDSKKDILMINWQAHVDTATSIGYNLISPSWPGVLRDTVSDATGMEVAYFTGASGNTNKDSRIPGEDGGYSWTEYGQKMGQIAVGLLDVLEPVEGAEIKTTRVIQEVSIDHSWDDKLEQANEVYDLWKGTDGKPGNKATAELLAKSYDFSSVYQARDIRTRAAMGATDELELNAFSIGGIGFITGTYEMWGPSALHVKSNSPFDLTFVITGNRRYIPQKDAYDYRSYEADTSLYARGTAEILEEKYVEMLKSLK